MWHCSRCGEAIQDNFDTCGHCGARRNDAASHELQEETGNPFVPVPQAELLAPEPTTDDEMTPDGPTERALTQESLATLLMRILGLYITAFGIISAIGEITGLVFLSRTLGADQALARYHFEALIHPAAELLIGTYLLIGGQWVYDKILTPIGRRSSEDDDFEDPQEN